MIICQIQSFFLCLFFSLEMGSDRGTEGLPYAFASRVFLKEKIHFRGGSWLLSQKSSASFKHWFYCSWEKKRKKNKKYGMLPFQQKQWEVAEQNKQDNFFLRTLMSTNITTWVQQNERLCFYFLILWCQKSTNICFGSGDTLTKQLFFAWRRLKNIQKDNSSLFRAKTKHIALKNERKVYKRCCWSMEKKLYDPSLFFSARFWTFFFAQQVLNLNITRRNEAIHEIMLS